MAIYPFAPEDGANYTLVAPLQTAQFNQPLDPNYVGATTGITGLDSADVRDGGDVYAQSDGGYPGQQFYGRRPIVMKGMIYGFTSEQQRATRMATLRRAVGSCMRADGLLSWVPHWASMNYVLNGTFEPISAYGIASGVQGWSSGTQAGYCTLGAAVTSTAAVAHSGTNAMQIVTNTSASLQGAYAFLGGGDNNFQPLPAGTYTFSVWVKGAAGGEALTLRTGIAGAATGGPVNFTATSSWAQYSSTFTSDGITPTYISIADTTATAKTFYVDDVTVTAGTVAPATAFDGSTAGYWWSGVPANSWSGNAVPMYTPVRQQLPLRFTGNWVKDFQASFVSAKAPLQSLFVINTPSVVASGGTSPVLQAENYGDAAAYPLINVYGPTASGFNITSYNGGPQTGAILVGAFGALSGGETLTIDCQQHTAWSSSRGDLTGVVDLVNSVWCAMLPGLNQFYITDGSMSLTYRHAWL